MNGLQLLLGFGSSDWNWGEGTGTCRLWRWWIPTGWQLLGSEQQLPLEAVLVLMATPVFGGGGEGPVQRDLGMRVMVALCPGASGGSPYPVLLGADRQEPWPESASRERN